MSHCERLHFVFGLYFISQTHCFWHRYECYTKNVMKDQEESQPGTLRYPLTQYHTGEKSFFTFLTGIRKIEYTTSWRDDNPGWGSPGWTHFVEGLVYLILTLNMDETFWFAELFPLCEDKWDAAGMQHFPLVLSNLSQRLRHKHCPPVI